MNDDVKIMVSSEDLTKPQSMVKTLSDYDLCVTGPALTILAPTELYKTLLARIFVYARVSPDQKELIVRKLKSRGWTVMMCGDGTNDVGGLKAADVGVALLDGMILVLTINIDLSGNVEDMEKMAKLAHLRRMEEFRKKQEETFKAWGLKVPPQQAAAAQRQQQMMNSMMENMDGEPPALKFGDASVAAPFTSKLGSIQSRTCF